MRLRAFVNEGNFKVFFDRISPERHFDLYEEYKGSMDTIRDDSDLDIEGICYGFVRNGSAYGAAIIREEALRQNSKGPGDDRNAMIMVPMAMNQEEIKEEISRHLLNKKVRCRKVQEDRENIYDFSIGLVPAFTDTIRDTLAEVNDLKDHIGIGLSNGKVYDLRIPNIDAESIADLCNVLRIIIGSEIIIDVDADGKIMTLFAAGKLPPEESPEGELLYARFYFMPYEYCEYMDHDA